MSASIPSSDQSFWNPSKSVVLLLVCLFILHWSTIGFSFRYWWNSFTYGHGLLVFPLSVFLIWKKRSKLNMSPSRPSWLGFSLFVFLNMGWWIGYAVDVEIIKQLTFFGMIGAIFWSILGWRTTSIYLIPLILPLFALPLWSPLLPLLQYLTTQVVSFAISLIDIPIYVENHFIHIPEGKFSIEEVCAGLRYALAALLVALVYVYLYIDNIKYGLIFIVSVVLLSLVVNWIRVFIVILAGHLTNMTHSFVKDHADFGWWLFAFTLIPIFWLGGYLVKKEQKSTKRREELGLVNQNASANFIDSNNKSSKYFFSTLLAFMLIITLSGFYVKERNRQIVGTVSVNLQAPKPSGQWSGPYEEKNTSTKISYPGADRELIASYKKDDHEAMLYVAQYLYQEPGKELIGEHNRPYNSSIWAPVANVTRQVKLPNGNIGEVHEVITKSESGKTRLSWYWYSIGGIDTISPIKVKILQMRDMFLEEKPGSSVIVLSLSADKDADSARNIMMDYYSNFYNGINAAVYEK